MQAIVETLFDAVYLISVITIGILMIRGSKGSAQFKLFGLMAVVLGAGDSFLTSFLMCYLDSAKRGEDGAEAIERALDFAAGFASTVCGMEGSWGHGAPIVE